MTAGGDMEHSKDERDDVFPWGRVYIGVAVSAVVVMLLLWLFSNHFTPR
jgi:hypothetical protein